MANAAAGKEKELNDKVKQKNLQLAQLGKERGDLVQDVAKGRAIIAKLGGGDEAATAVEQQMKATKAMQDTISKLEGPRSRKRRTRLSALTGKALQAEASQKDLKKQLDEAESQMTDALDARAKLEGQLSEMLKNSGDRDAHEKQMAMIKADRDARITGEKDAIDKAALPRIAALEDPRHLRRHRPRARRSPRQGRRRSTAEARMARDRRASSPATGRRATSRPQDEIAELRKQAAEGRRPSIAAGEGRPAKGRRAAGRGRRAAAQAADRPAAICTSRSSRR